MDIYNMVTAITDNFMLLVLFTFAVTAIVGGLLQIDVSSSQVQEGEYEKAVILENLLSLRASEEELAATSSAYNYDRQKAVLPIQYFTNQDPADDEIGYYREGGNCYIEEVPGLNGQDYGFHVRPISSPPGDVDLACSDGSVQSGDMGAEAILVNGSSEESRLNVKMVVFPIGGGS